IVRRKQNTVPGLAIIGKSYEILPFRIEQGSKVRAGGVGRRAGRDHARAPYHGIPNRARGGSPPPQENKFASLCQRGVAGAGAAFEDRVRGPQLSGTRGGVGE